MTDNNTSNAAGTPAVNPNIATEVTNTASDPRNVRVVFDGEGGSRTEYLYTDGNVQASTADVGSYPTGEQFEAEIAHHQTEIANLQARLAEQIHDRAGKVTGYVVSGDRDRAVLQQRITTHQQTLAWTVQRLAAAHTTTEQKIAACAKAEAEGETTEQTSLQAQANRSAAIAELADQTINGVRIGHSRAAQMIDEASARARADSLVRRGR
jgi:hypothetical protein